MDTHPQKIALVTGGSRGLGHNTVLSLAGRGVASIFTYNSNRTEAEKVAALAGEAGTKATALQLDVGDASAFDFKGVFFLTQKLLPLINDGRRIVNLSTGLTRVAMANRAAHGSIKGAVEVPTKYMAKELGPRGIGSMSWRRARLPRISAAAWFATTRR